jgi:hypothetical protein
VAQERLQIRLDAIDNTKRALSGLKGSLSSIKNAAFSLKGALVGLGGGLVIRSFINTGRSVEDLQVRLKQLFGSTQEGAKAFDVMAKFAARVPFSLEQIQAASGNLAVVAGDADRLATILEITGNVAAVTGLDFQQTAEQIQRAFSGGIAAADVFRERGVRDLLGFSAGATISAEETVKAFQDVFGGNGRFGKATDELANTFTGTLSMLGDKLFNFKRDVAGAGFFDELKKEFKDLNKFIEENAKDFEAIGRAISKVLTLAVKGFAAAIRALASAGEALRSAYDFLFGDKGLKQGIENIPDAVGDGVQEVKKLTTNLVIAKDTITLVTEELAKQNDNYKIQSEIVKGIQGFAKGFSQSLAEALVLGKSLNISMKELAQQILVSIVQKTLERITLLFIEEVILKRLRQYWDSVTQGVKQTNAQLKQQIALQAVLMAFGGGGGGFFGFAEGGRVNGSRANGGQTSNGNAYMVGERGRELFIPSTDGQIVPNEKLGGLGTTNINFTVQATDVKGVKELLIDNRATITNIINSALNQKGKPALI